MYADLLTHHWVLAVAGSQPLSDVVSFSVNGELSGVTGERVHLAYLSAFDGLCF